MMNVSIPHDLGKFVRLKVQSGDFPSEEAVVEAALRRLQEQEGLAVKDLIDQEFVDYCALEGNDRITIEEVWNATSRILGSMAHTVIEDERADRT